jgi:acetyl esterase/lipase
MLHGVGFRESIGRYSPADRLNSSGRGTTHIGLLQSTVFEGEGIVSTRHLLAEELHPIIEQVPAVDITERNLPKVRALGAEAVVLGNPEAAGVVREEIRVPGADGDVRCLYYRPEKAGAGLPAYLHIHGGGYITGSVEGSDIGNIAIASKLGAVVLSVDYRLAPEHPIPAPLDDCFAALVWVHDQAEALGIDSKRIAIGGESAGGGLAAALAIRARDAGGLPICHQHLTYPMLDNLTGSDEHPGDPLVGEFVWTRARNQFGWKSYLGEAPAEAPQVPARLEDFSGLPRTWMFTATLDLFRDENLLYAQKLMAAGVPVEMLVYPEACHGFQFVPGTRIGARYIADHMAALARGLCVEKGVEK